jgi:hypothetical protein
MPSATDFINAINAVDGDVKLTDADVKSMDADVSGRLDTVNNNLNDIKGKLDTLNNSVLQVDSDVQKMQQLLLWGFQQLITLGQYTNQALSQNDKQNETMICILKQISVNTCGIWNEAHQQTGLQTKIESEARMLADLFAATHAEAELARQERELLQLEIEKCCPPKRPEPICAERPCPAPPPLDQEPPQTQPPPQFGAPTQVETAPLK